jgi:hypothetical protein
MTNAERYPGLVHAFRLAIYDQIAEQHPDGYVHSVANLTACAWAAIKEVMEAETETVDALLALNVWKAVMLCNDSAFRQSLNRAIENKEPAVAKIKLANATTKIAKGYAE